MSSKLYFHPDRYVYKLYSASYIMYIFLKYILLQISICLSKIAADPAALSWRQRFPTVDSAFVAATRYVLVDITYVTQMSVVQNIMCTKTILVIGCI